MPVELHHNDVVAGSNPAGPTHTTLTGRSSMVERVMFRYSLSSRFLEFERNWLLNLVNPQTGHTFERRDECRCNYMLLEREMRVRLPPTLIAVKVRGS